MKVTFEFNLPDEENEYRRFANSQDAWRAVVLSQELIRDYRKYQEHSKKNLAALVEKLNDVFVDVALQDI